jgi:hypothetical protein
MTADSTASTSGAEPRAFVFLKSRRRLDLLNPDPHAIASPTRPFGGSSTNRDAASAPMQAVTASWTVSTRSPFVKRGTSFAHERPANPIPKAICAFSLGESQASLSAGSASSLTTAKLGAKST